MGLGFAADPTSTGSGLHLTKTLGTAPNYDLDVLDMGTVDELVWGGTCVSMSRRVRAPRLFSWHLRLSKTVWNVVETGNPAHADTISGRYY